MQESNEFRPTRIFEEISSIARLEKSFVSVFKNKGSAGIDGVTVEMYKRDLANELSKLHQELLEWTYTPQPVRRVEIDKPDGNGKRKLGIPSVRDRVVQGAIKSVLEPILDPEFSQNSYGFRPNKGQQQAIAAAQKIVQSGKEYVVDIDLEQFFDRVGHDRLIFRLGQRISDKRVLRLIGLILRSGVMTDGLVKPGTEGTPQGSPLSPLLSNVVLDELDKELEKRGIDFVRFADDCNLFVSSKAAADRVMASTKSFIEKKLRLKVNEKKSKVAKSSQVKFLGMTVLRDSVAIAPKALKKAMSRVRELTPRGTNLPIEQAIKKINSWYIGWAAYFKMTNYPSQLRVVEAHIRRRLRGRIVKQQKRPRYLCRKLIKMGVNARVAYKTAYSGRGPWNLSHQNGVERAFTNKWFARQGLKIVSDKAMEHWLNPKVWIKLMEEPCT